MSLEREDEEIDSEKRFIVMIVCHVCRLVARFGRWICPFWLILNYFVGVEAMVGGQLSIICVLLHDRFIDEEMSN